MAVNSYLLHARDGIVLVDAQLTISDAQLVRDAIEATGRPLAAIVITHPHPDHYAGAAVITSDQQEVPMLATAAVAEVIARDDALKERIVGAMMGEQWPSRRRFPNQIVESGTTVNLAGLDLIARDLGAGESHADSIWSIGDRWFVGDMLCPDMDAYLADGHYDTWLSNLAHLHDTAPTDTVFYVGHGVPIGRDGIGPQRAYLQAFLTAVEHCLDLDPPQRQTQVVDRMRAIPSDHRLQFLMELSIEPVADSLRTTIAARAQRPR